MAELTEDVSWIQINNTVVPVIQRLVNYEHLQDLVPLPVIQYGAGLLTDISVESVPSTPSECRHLSKLCACAGFEFNFAPETKLILLSDLRNLYKELVVFTKLPNEDPFSHAQSVKQEQSMLGDAQQISNVKSLCRENSPTPQTDVDSDSPLDLSRREGTNIDVEMSVNSMDGVIMPSGINKTLQRNTRFLNGKEVRFVTKHGVDFITLEEVYNVFFRNVPVPAFLRIIHTAGVPDVHDSEKKGKEIQIPVRTIRFEDTSELLVRARLIIRGMKYVRAQQKIETRRRRQRVSESTDTVSDVTNQTSSSEVHLATKSTSQHSVQNSTSDLNDSLPFGLPAFKGNIGVDTKKDSFKVGNVKTDHELKRKRLLDTVTKLYVKKNKLPTS